MLTVENGFGSNGGLWTFTLGKGFDIVPIMTTKPEDYFLNKRIERLKKRNETRHHQFVGAGFLMPTTDYYDNVKEIKRETVLVKKYEEDGYKGEPTIRYDVEFEVHVIYYDIVYKDGQLLIV